MREQLSKTRVEERDKNYRKLDRKFHVGNNTTGTNLNRPAAHLPGNSEKGQQN